MKIVVVQAHAYEKHNDSLRRVETIIIDDARMKGCLLWKWNDSVMLDLKELSFLRT